METLDLEFLNYNTDMNLVFNKKHLKSHIIAKYPEYMAILIRDCISPSLTPQDLSCLNFYIEHFVYECESKILSIKRMPMITILLLTYPTVTNVTDRRQYYRLPYKMEVNTISLEENDVYTSLEAINRIPSIKPKKLETVDISSGGLKLSSQKKVNYNKQIIVYLTEPEALTLLCNVKEISFDESTSLYYYMLEYVGIKDEVKKKIGEFINSQSSD